MWQEAQKPIVDNKVTVNGVVHDVTELTTVQKVALIQTGELLAHDVARFILEVRAKGFAQRPKLRIVTAG